MPPVVTLASDAVANQEQIRFWNEDGGPKWVDFQERLDRLIAPLGEALLRAIAARPGQFVLEIGCGTGYNAVEIGRQVTASGLVVGIDVSRVMLDAARRRPADRLNLQFHQADAQTADLGRGIFDVVASRFGIMFFADPVAAFANLRRALKPGGRCVFLCWQSPRVNPWVSEPMRLLSEHLPLPEPPPPGAPGPFSLADVDRLEEVLNGAGFGDYDIVPARATVSFGDSIDEAVEFTANIGPTSRLLSEADEAQRGRFLAAIRQFFASRSGIGGKVEMEAASWVVTARPC